MSRLLLLLGTLGTLGTLGGAVQDLAPPTNLRFDSVDYKNVLSWSPPANGSSLLYDVQWKIYGDPDWLDAASCRGTQKLRCDLSSETSVPREWYYARVPVITAPHTPAARISPPVLKLKVSQQKVVVQVEPPRLHIRKMHSSLQFKIYLTHPSGEEELFLVDPRSRKLTLHLRHRQRYCVQAQTQILLQAKSSARSPPTCVSTL
uniref:Helical cytokine receptor CRFB9 n=1 Tax=Tetraodon nigroviridis TaxID=99883 RepID=Q7ZT05_TETNG|nr:helical cytokine receptor CRFB9 [Tetraodon nigroviridis]CAD67783.1 helical cytokine receptor CRFB9 [Tetraodon nigroviridis]